MAVMTAPRAEVDPSQGAPFDLARPGTPEDERAHPWRRRRLPRLGLVVACLVLLRVENGPVGGLIFGFLLITPLELAFRRHEQRVRRRGLRADVLHLLLTGALGSVATVIAVVAWFIVLLPVTLGRRNPLFVAQPLWLQVIETIVALELMGYVAHRAMHEVPAFWRFHAIHHSSSTLDWVSGARAHPVEGFIGGAIAAPPLLLLGIDPSVVGVYSVVVGAWGVFLHANVRWRFRWLDGWWSTPDYHHWHHSNHPEARNRNFGAFLPVFDRLFGTYYQPKDRRPYVYGIDEAVPDDWLGQLRWPWRRAHPSAEAATLGTAPVAAAVFPPSAAPPPWPMTSPLPPSLPPLRPSSASSAASASPAASAPLPLDAAEADDRLLVARIAAGDRGALEALYRLHAGWLTSRLQRRCPDPDLVDTALQDTFVVVWRAAGTFRGRGDVAAWLWGIAIRKLIDQVRRHQPTPLDPAVLGASTGGRPWPAASSGGAEVASAEAELFARGIGGDLAQALARLDPDLRAVLLATAVDGLTTKEAATLLGIPQGTVKTRLQRARAHLQERLG